MTTSTLSATAANGAGGFTSGNDGTFTLKVGNDIASQVNALVISASGQISLGQQTVSASVANTVTNKVAIVINGTTYYLLASTSGT